MFTLELHLIILHSDIKLLGHSSHFVELSVHGSFAKLNHWSHDELNETSLELATVIGIGVILPFLGFCIKVIVTPELFHHFSLVNTKFGCVGLSEHSDGEGPSEKG